MGIKVRQMKTYMLSVLQILIFSTSIYLCAETEIEKTDLKEVYTISDIEADSYRFIWPNSVIVLPDNSILISDKNQLLHFDTNGNFLRNLIKTGEGPGEIAGPFSCYPSDGSIYLYDYIKTKAVNISFKGGLLNEWKLDEAAESIISLNSKRMLILKESAPPRRKREGIAKMKTELCRANIKGKIKEKLFTFPLRVMCSESGIQSIDNLLINFIDSNTVVASWKREYEINIVDLKEGKITKTFKRPFTHIKSSTPAGRVEGYCDYLPDIKKIIINNREIWIETSEKTETGSNIIDRFSYEGQYISSFYTNIKGHLIQVRKHHFYYLIQDSEDNPTVKKYVKEKYETNNELFSSQYRNPNNKNILLLPDS